jgi:hypothetical protein
MSRRLTFVIAAVAVLAASACSTIGLRAPLCDEELEGDVLAIEAQSVPTAELVPCVGALPVGWSFQSFEVSDRGTTFYLDSDRAGAQAVRVDLKPTCDTGGATEVPADTPGTRQFERIDSLGDRYGGSRYYLFEGGCVTYRFDFEGEGRTELAREVSLALDFFPRADLDQMAADIGIDSRQD